jgi:hypothetical protein
VSLTIQFLFLQKILIKSICNRATQQLPGLISLSSKFLPTVMNLLKRLAEEGQIPATNDPQRNPPLASKSFRNGVSASNDTSSSASSGVTSSEYSSPSKEE